MLFRSGSTNYPKISKLPQISRRQKGDIKQYPSALSKMPSSERAGHRGLWTCDLDELRNLSLQVIIRSIPVAASSKVWVCCRSLAGIVGSNPAGGMGVCLLWVLCVVRQRSLRRASHSSRGVLPSVGVWSRNPVREAMTRHRVEAPQETKKKIVISWINQLIWCQIRRHRGCDSTHVYPENFH